MIFLFCYRNRSFSSVGTIILSYHSEWPRINHTISENTSSNKIIKELDDAFMCNFFIPTKTLITKKMFLSSLEEGGKEPIQGAYSDNFYNQFHILDWFVRPNLVPHLLLLSLSLALTVCLYHFKFCPNFHGLAPL